MKLKIPSVYKPALKKLIQLPDDQKNHLLDALASADPSLKTKSITKQVAQSFKGEIGDLEDIINMLIGLSIARFNVEVSVEQFAQDISNAIESEDVKTWKLESDRSSFIPYIKSVLETRSIALSAQAGDIQREFENVYDHGRVLTDIRPTFGSTGTEVTGMMVVHSFQISFYNGQDRKDFYVAMSDEDVSSLRKLLDRAELKSKSLEKSIKQLGLPYFESK